MTSDGPIRIDKAPGVSFLGARHLFDGLTQKEKLYAHYSARAAWEGAPIIMRQTSPESIFIFSFILDLYQACGGNWEELSDRTDVSREELNYFLDYAAVFLGNIGNYFGQGDQKFVPAASMETFEKLSTASASAQQLWKEIASPMTAPLPIALGFPSQSCQSSYYLGDSISKDEVEIVARVMGRHSIEPENTRIQKFVQDGKLVLDILQASTERDELPRELQQDGDVLIRLMRGDHWPDLKRIRSSLELAHRYAANPTQESFLTHYLQSFKTGDIEAFKESQRVWVKDIQPSIEVIFGFVEPYRDPQGVRAEFEGLTAIVDKEETKLLSKLVQHSSTFVRRLPWAENTVVNDGKGPFEKEIFESPDFTSLHTLAYCSSIIFPGINLPNFNDIRQQVGFKNVMITNSMTARNSNPTAMANLLDPSQVSTFVNHREHAFYLWVVFHELLGHGTGKLLTESEAGIFNFDIDNPPVSPLTGKPVDSWYHPGQTWTGLFSDIATTVDECRAECVGAYLMSDMELLAMFGYTNETEVTGRDLEYNMYLQLGVAGLRALENYNIQDRRWGQAHSRAHFAMLKVLLATGDNFLTISHNTASNKLTVSVDGTKIITHGQSALASLMLKLHIWRCTADVKACREYYEALTDPVGIFLEWRSIVLANKPPAQVFVQPNTFVKNGEVVLNEYEATVKGMIQSWAERMISVRE